MVATRLQVGEYEAWMVVEDEEVEHFRIEVNQSAKIATCYISSTVGKCFGIWVVQKHDRFKCTADVSLDGHEVQAGNLNRMCPYLIDGVWIGKRSYQPFLFGHVDLTDDESFLNPAQSYEELGSVKVKIDHVTKYEETPRTKSRKSKTMKHNKVHESSKKAALHRVSLGRTRRTEESGFDVAFKWHKTVATFIFQYRPIDILRANGIAPNPSPVTTEAAIPLSRKRKAMVKEEDTTLETEREDEEYRRKIAELEGEIGRLKKEQADKKLKCEPKSPFLRGELIDLTVDDLNLAATVLNYQVDS